MLKSVEEQMNEILQEVGYEAKNAIGEAAYNAACRTVKKLKATSPASVHGKKKGAYAKGWAIKEDNHAQVVYNRRFPGLTHLLENGHITKNQYGEFGRTPAHPHIKQVEETESEAYLEEVKSMLESKL